MYVWMYVYECIYSRGVAIISEVDSTGYESEFNSHHIRYNEAEHVKLNLMLSKL